MHFLDQPYRPQQSLAFSRERDARISWLLDMHPVTAAMLVAIGWFPSKYKALKRLQRLVRRGKIRLVGTVNQKSGRPENVFCRWTPKSDQLLHEVQLTQFCLGLDAGKILRGPHIQNTDIRPDAEVWINGVLYYLEWDRGTMGYGQVVRDRFYKYEGCRQLALWVCATASRREGLRGRAECIRDVALFAIASEALATPHGPIWIDAHGGSASLPRQGKTEERKTGPQT